MSHQWDEFTKSLAEPVPRRESLRRLGAVFAGAILAPLGMKPVRGGGRNPCKELCNQCPKWVRTQCLSACQACGGNASRLCGSCGSVACCGQGEACCGGYCTDLASDIYNCGSCGDVCDAPGPYEYGACIAGKCEYECVDGAVRCGDSCILTDWDPDNCGGCGNVCGAEAPYCNYGVCLECSLDMTMCGGACVDVDSDNNNCGACGNVCGGLTPVCSNGTCISWDEPCPGGGTRCSGVCTNTNFDLFNCGGCGIRCTEYETCSGGACQSPF